MPARPAQPETTHRDRRLTVVVRSLTDAGRLGGKLGGKLGRRLGWKLGRRRRLEAGS